MSLIKLLREIDRYLVRILAHLVPKKWSKTHNYNNILIIKLWALGDSIPTLPLINSLKKAGKEVDILCTPRNKPIYEDQEVINNLYLLNKFIPKWNHYDLAIDLEPYLNISSLVGWFCGRALMGFSGQPRSRLYSLSIPFNKEKHIVQIYLDFARKLNLKAIDNLIPLTKEKNKVAKIGICPGVGKTAKSRMWDNKKWAQLCDELSQFGPILFVGKEDEVIHNIQRLMKERSIYKRVSLKELFKIINGLDLFISVDTGPLHIAAAQGVKTIGLFGPNTPTIWGPYGKGNISIYKKTDCSPCIQNDKGLMPDCRDNICMQRITVDDVYRASLKLLNRGI